MLHLFTEMIPNSKELQYTINAVTIATTTITPSNTNTAVTADSIDTSSSVSVSFPTTIQITNFPNSAGM